LAVDWLKISRDHLTGKGVASWASKLLGLCEKDFHVIELLFLSQRWTKSIIEERVYLQVIASIYATPRFEKQRPILDLSKYEPPLDDLKPERFGHYAKDLHHSVCSYFLAWIAMALVCSQKESSTN
jgi:hypothetical protein